MCDLKGCSCFEILLSIVIGAIVAGLFAFFLLPCIFNAVLVTIAIAVLILVALVILLSQNTFNSNVARCLAKIIRCIIIAAIGTLIFGLIAISIMLFPPTIASVIIVFLLFTFFSLLIISTIAFLIRLLHRA